MTSRGGGFRWLALVGGLSLFLVAAVSVSAAKLPLPTPRSNPPAATAPKPVTTNSGSRLIFSTPAATGPVAQPPGGVTATPTAAIMPSTTGTDIQFTNLDKTQFSNLWWGPAQALAAGGVTAGLAFDGDGTVDPATSEQMAFATSQPDLAAGKEYWTGSSASLPATACQGTNPCNPCATACPTRLVITVTDPTGATPIPLTAAGAVNGIPASAGAVAQVSGNFKVNLTMQMQVPGSAAWSDPKTWYDNLPFLMTDKDAKMMSTFDGGFWYLAASFTAVKNQQYTLANSDGTTWVEFDPTNEVSILPGFDQIAVIGGNLDLWTANTGFNQDIAIFVSDNGGADSLVAWKESGGFAGTFSPNAAFVQGVMSVTAGHNYIFKLKWKTSHSASGATIFAGAGPLPAPNPPQISPTRLTVKMLPGPANQYVYDSVTNTQETLAGSDGKTWAAMDATGLRLTIAPAVDSTALLGANADLWTANAGINQDIAIFVSDNGGADSIVGWKESGGFAGTFSPNAAFLQSVFAMTAGHSYVFTMKWKTNQAAAGKTIFAGAGPLPAPNPPQISPSRLTAIVLPNTAAAIVTAATNTQYPLANSNGATWTPMDATNLKLDVTPTASTMAIVSANVDLWTANAGFNQDVAVFVAVDAGTTSILAWKESGGFAGTFSPNAAFVQAEYAMATGHTYHFTLQWKTNKGGTSTIFAGAGPLPAPNPPQISPTRLALLFTT